MRFKTGLTLVELLIAISLLGLVTFSAVSINLTAGKMLSGQNTQVQLANQASYGLELIVKDILNSFGDPPGSTNIAFRILNLEGNELQLRRRDLGSSGADAADGWVAYRINGNKLEYNNNCIPVAGVCTGLTWSTVIENVVTPTSSTKTFQEIGANSNIIQIQINCRQNPAQLESVLNPGINLVTAARIPAAPSN